MKIVDVCAFYAPRGGGVRTYVDRKLETGPRFGHEIVVIAPGETSRVEWRGARARILWLESPRLPLDFNYRFFADTPALHAMLDAERPDIVEASSPWRSASMVADWRGSARRVMIMHADPLSAYAYRWFEGLATRPAIDRQFDWYWRHLRRLDQRFDAIVSASDSLTERLTAGGLRQAVTIPMGTEPGIFSPALRDDKLRAQMLSECGLKADATLLIGVGRHAPEKRWTLVIDAAISAGMHDPVGLVLIGDGRERARLIRRVGANPHVRLLSPMSDRGQLARIIASADALIHGCEAETFCMVAAEARASGLPLITPDLGGASDQARASGGLCYASGDARSAAEAITTLIANRRSAGCAGTPHLSTAARSMDDHFADLFALYRNIERRLERAA